MFEEETILRYLKELKVDKASGPDELSPRLLSEIREQMAGALKILLQKSLDQGKLPTDRKKAIFVPIHKKGRRDLTENYRPVSLTSIVCKIMEKIMRNVLLDHLMGNNLISDRQFGFLPGRSCVLQLLVCMEEWTKSLDTGKQVDVIYTDYSKAFDKV